MAKIEIDATNKDLVFGKFIIIGFDSDHELDAGVVQTVDLEPNKRFQILIQSGVVPPWSFTVTDDGTVDFETQFDGFLTGRGKTRLTIQGFKVTLDARSLSGGNGVVFVSILGLKFGFIGGDAPKTIRLTPQNGYMVEQGSASRGPIFDLDFNGHFQFIPALDGALAGRDTDTLQLLGRPVLIDARAADPPGASIDNVVGLSTVSKDIQVVTLLPADFGYRLSYKIDGKDKGPGFLVNTDGTAGFVSNPSDPSLLSLGTIAAVTVRAEKA